MSEVHSWQSTYQLLYICSYSREHLINSFRIIQTQWYIIIHRGILHTILLQTTWTFSTCVYSCLSTHYRLNISLESTAQTNAVITHLSLKNSIMSFITNLPFRCFSRMISYPLWSPLSPQDIEMYQSIYSEKLGFWYTHIIDFTAWNSRMLLVCGEVQLDLSS